MDINVIKTRLSEELKKRNAFLLLAIGSIFLNILLGLVLLIHTPEDRTILVPLGFEKSFWVDKKGVSASYLAEMTRYFATLKLNMTPDSSDYQINQILQYTNPRTYGTLKAELVKEADSLKNEGLTSAFFPTNVEVDVPHLNAIITGDLAYFVGKEETSSYRVSYLAQYAYDNGRLYLNSFKEVNKHD